MALFTYKILFQFIKRSPQNVWIIRHRCSSTPTQLKTLCKISEPKFLHRPTQPKTMAAWNILKLSALVSLLSNLNYMGVWPDNTPKSYGVFPPTCNRIECPTFETIHVGNGFEIRRYNSTLWISTSPIHDISLKQATRTGFLK